MDKKEYQRNYYQEHKEERNEYWRRWKRNNKDKINKSVKKQRRRIKLIVLTYYSTADYPVCARCGIVDIDMLCLDHIDGGGNEDRRKRNTLGGWMLYTQLKQEGYPEGYQVLCFNCNMKKQIVEGK